MKTRLPHSIIRLVLLLGTLFCMGMAQAQAQNQAPDAVATVNNEPISVTAFQQRYRLAKWASAQQLRQLVQTYGEKALTDPASPYSAQYRILTTPADLGRQVIDGLITIKLVQQEAAKRNLTVSDDEVQQQIYAFFGYTPGVIPAPTGPNQAAAKPEELLQAFEANRDNYFGQAGVTAKMAQTEVLATFAEQALQVKLYQALTSDLPAKVDQVKVRHILADTEEKAKTLMQQIKGGAPFAEVAKVNSLDTSSAALGGDLGWSPKRTYVAELEAVIWSAKIGELTGPVKSPFGYHILIVEGREMRPLTAADQARARDGIFKQWLASARTSSQIVIVENWRTFIPPDPSLKELGLPEPH